MRLVETNTAFVLFNLPFNLAMPEATLANETVDGEELMAC